MWSGSWAGQEQKYDYNQQELMVKYMISHFTVG